MDGAEKKDVENCICSLLTSNPLRMTIQDLYKDYKKMIGTPVPFKKFGCNTLEDFLRSIPNRVQVIGSGNFAEVRVVVSQKSAHINDLICKQKVVKNKKNYQNGLRKYVKPMPQQRYSQNQFNRYSNSAQTSTPIKTPPPVVNEKISSDEDDNVSVPYAVRRKLKDLVLDYSDGLLCSKIPELFSQKYNEKFNFHQYGYRSVAQLCLDMPSKFKYQHCENGDVRIFDSKVSVPLSPIRPSTPKPTDVVSSEKKNTEPALPDDFDDILLGFHKAKLPENCILVDNIERQWLGPAVQVLDYIDVNVAEVYDPSKFWIHLKEYSDELDELMDDMQEFYRQNKAQYEVPFYALTKGMYVACMFDKEYHRAKILDCSKKMQSLLKMFFIDYGTVATVYTTGVCYLVTEFTALSAQAIRARLHGIQPVVKDEFWPREAALRLLELVNRKEHLVAQIMWIDNKEQTLDIVLANTSIPDEDFYINDALVSENYAKFIDEIQNEPKQKNYIPSVQCVHLFPTHDELETGLAPSMYQMVILEQTNVTTDSIFPQYFSKTAESVSNKSDTLEEEALNAEDETPKELSWAEKCDLEEIENSQKTSLPSSPSPVLDEDNSVKTDCSNPTSPEIPRVSSSETGMPRRPPPGFAPLAYPTPYPTVFIPQINMIDPQLYALWANTQYYASRQFILNQVQFPYNNAPPFSYAQYPPGIQQQSTTRYQHQVHDHFYRTSNFPCSPPQYPPEHYNNSPRNMGNFSGQQNFSQPVNMNMNFNFSRQVNPANTADMYHYSAYENNPNSPNQHKRISRNQGCNTEQFNLTNLRCQKNDGVGIKNCYTDEPKLKGESIKVPLKISEDKIKSSEKIKREIKENRLKTESPQSRSGEYQFENPKLCRNGTAIEPLKITENKIKSISAETIDADAKFEFDNPLPEPKVSQNDIAIEPFKIPAEKIKCISTEKIAAETKFEINDNLPEPKVSQNGIVIEPFKTPEEKIECISTEKIDTEAKLEINDNLLPEPKVSQNGIALEPFKTPEEKIERISAEKIDAEAKFKINDDLLPEPKISRNGIAIEPFKTPEEKIDCISAEKIAAEAKFEINDNLLPEPNVGQNGIAIEPFKTPEEKIECISAEKIDAEAKLEINDNLLPEPKVSQNGIAIEPFKTPQKKIECEKIDTEAKLQINDNPLPEPTVSQNGIVIEPFKTPEEKIECISAEKIDAEAKFEINDNRLLESKVSQNRILIEPFKTPEEKVECISTNLRCQKNDAVGIKNCNTDESKLKGESIKVPLKISEDKIKSSETIKSGIKENLLKTEPPQSRSDEYQFENPKLCRNDTAIEPLKITEDKIESISAEKIAAEAKFEINDNRPPEPKVGENRILIEPFKTLQEKIECISAEKIAAEAKFEINDNRPPEPKVGENRILIEPFKTLQEKIECISAEKIAAEAKFEINDNRPPEPKVGENRILIEPFKTLQEKIECISAEKIAAEAKFEINDNRPPEPKVGENRILIEPFKTLQEKIECISAEKIAAEAKFEINDNRLPEPKVGENRILIEPFKTPQEKIECISAEKIDAEAKSEINGDLPPDPENDIPIEPIKNKIGSVSVEKIDAEARSEITDLDILRELKTKESPINNESQIVVVSTQEIKCDSENTTTKSYCFDERHLVEVKCIGGLDFHILNIRTKQFLVFKEVMRNLFGAVIPTHIIRKRFESSPPFVDILSIVLDENFELAQELLRYNLVKGNSKTLEIVSIDDSIHVVTVLKAASDNKKCDAFLKSFKTAI